MHSLHYLLYYFSKFKIYPSIKFFSSFSMCFLGKCKVYIFFWSFNILSHGYTRLIVNGTAEKILYPFWSKCKHYILNVIKISLSCATGANLKNILYVIRMLPSLQWSLDNKFSQHVYDIYILPAWWVDFFCGFSICPLIVSDILFDMSIYMCLAVPCWLHLCVHIYFRVVTDQACDHDVPIGHIVVTFWMNKSATYYSPF